jgi:haloalkane dehalogenase
VADIDSTMRYEKREIEVHGKKMAYVDAGGPGDPIVFLHGNITQSYMWRNVIPHVEPFARCIALDNIGQGDSEKLDDSGPDSYRLAEHQHYVDGFLDLLDLGDAVTLMMHDWGVQLGLTWGNAHRSRVKGIAHMQGLMGNLTWEFWSPEVSALMRRFRGDDGEDLVLEQNFFVEKVLPAMVIRDLPDDVWDEYRRPYGEPGEGRRPMLTWPREIPVEGEPSNVLAMIEANNQWLAESPIPKLYIHVQPESVMKGHILDEVRTFPNQIEVVVSGLHYVQEDSPHEIGRALAEWYCGLG